MAERRSAAIAIGGRKGDAFDVSALSQSLPCKPGSLAKAAPVGKDEPPPLELPSSVPNHDPIDEERGRTLIRFTAEIEAEEFSCSPAQREVYLSQSCPNWGTFQMPGAGKADPAPQWKEEAPAEPAPGAMAVPGHTAVESLIEADVNIIGRSPTILESFKMYNGSGDEPEVSKLDEISEEVEPPPQDDEEEEDQFALDA